jgi:hypothetical protein
MKHNAQNFVTLQPGIFSELSGFRRVSTVLKRWDLNGNLPFETPHQGMATADSFMPLTRYRNIKFWGGGDRGFGNGE